MKSGLLDFSKQLISVPSTADNKQALNEVLDIVKKELNGFTIEEFEKKGFLSLLIYNTEKRQDKFKIILNAHLDVIPGTAEQYKAFEKDGKLYARGTYDMKAAAAAEILVFKELAKNLKYPIALQLVTDEETGGFNGTGHQVEKGVKADFVIAGEPTDFAINNEAKGIIWTKIKVKGKSAHGAYPWLGKNAILKTSEIIQSLNKLYPEPEKEVWQTTVNIAKIETSNEVINKVPDNCIISLDIRYIPEDKDKTLEKIKGILPENAEMEVVLKEPEQFTDSNNPYILKLSEAIKNTTDNTPQIVVKHGGADIRHFNKIGCAGITFGLIGYGHHTDNEWIEIESLDKFYEILKNFLLSI